MEHSNDTPICRRNKYLNQFERSKTESTYFAGNKHSLDSIVGSCKLSESFAASDMICSKNLYNYVNKSLLKISNVNFPFKLRRETKRSFIRFQKRNHKKDIFQVS